MHAHTERWRGSPVSTTARNPGDDDRWAVPAWLTGGPPAGVRGPVVFGADEPFVAPRETLHRRPTGSAA